MKPHKPLHGKDEAALLFLQNRFKVWSQRKMHSLYNVLTAVLNLFFSMLQTPYNLQQSPGQTISAFRLM